MIVLYGHLSFCLRSIKVVSAELALGRRRDEFIIPSYRHVQCFLTVAVTARCLRASVIVATFIPPRFRRQGRVSQSTLRHCSLPGSYQTSSRCTAGSSSHLHHILLYNSHIPMAVDYH